MNRLIRGSIICLVAVTFCVITASGVDDESNDNTTNHLYVRASTTMLSHSAGSNDCYLAGAANGRVNNYHPTEDARGDIYFSLSHDYLQVVWGGPSEMIEPAATLHDSVGYEKVTDPISYSHYGDIYCQSEGEIHSISESAWTAADSAISAP